MKDFQKRNKMSMQFLLMEKERKYINNLRKAANNQEDTITSELYDEHNFFDPEREPEIEQNISTSMFLKSTIENLGGNVPNSNELISTDIDSSMNNYKVKGDKLTTKQKLLREVGAVISSNRSNVGRFLKRKNSVITSHQYDQHMDVTVNQTGPKSFKARAL